MMSLKSIFNKNASLPLMSSCSSFQKPRAQTRPENYQPITIATKEFFAPLAQSQYQPHLFKAPPHKKKKSSSKKQERSISAYGNNYSFSLALPYSAEELENLTSQELFEKTKPLIIEHAARRVDLFFYTLVAYYNSKATPKQGPTLLQHGFGKSSLSRINKTQGCHSSFLPNLIDDLSFINEGLLTGTHFMDNLNSTVELPDYVNEFDQALEIDLLCRKKSLEILTLVAKGKLNPIGGLTEFLRMMDTLLNQVEANYFLIKSFYCKYESLTPALVKLTKEGTLSEKFSPEKNKVNRNYIELLLRLTPTEKAMITHQPNKRFGIYRTRIEEIQTEILATKSVYLPSLSQKECLCLAAERKANTP